jgi:hypothetical protein
MTTIEYIRCVTELQHKKISGLATGASFRSCYYRLQRVKCAAIFEPNVDARQSDSQAFFGASPSDVVGRGGECLWDIVED